MTLTFDVEDAAVRFLDLLAEVEAGNEIVISRDQRPIARLGKAVTTSPVRVEGVVAAIRAGRRNFAPTSMDEIIAWRDEGRR